MRNSWGFLLKGETWKIRDAADKKFIFGERNRYSKRKIMITIPAGYHFDFVKMSIGAGELVGTGIYTEECVMKAGAGQITMKDFYSGASKITCGMGEIVVQGELTGKCAVECGMGAVSLAIRDPGHFGYSTSVGFGEVQIGECHFGGMSGSHTVNAEDSNFYKINCSMGSVKVSFL